jgi:hypothetical protein
MFSSMKSKSNGWLTVFVVVIFALIDCQTNAQDMLEAEPLFVKVTLRQYDSLLHRYGRNIGQKNFLENLSYTDAMVIVRLKNSFICTQDDYDLPKKIKRATGLV